MHLEASKLKKVKKLANMSVINMNSLVVFRYYRTDILGIGRYSIIIYQHDYWTRTTKARINTLAYIFDLPLYVYEKRGNIYATFKTEIILLYDREKQKNGILNREDHITLWR